MKKKRNINKLFDEIINNANFLKLQTIFYKFRK